MHYDTLPNNYEKVILMWDSYLSAAGRNLVCVLIWSPSFGKYEKIVVLQFVFANEGETFFVFMFTFGVATYIDDCDSAKNI